MPGTNTELHTTEDVESVYAGLLDIGKNVVESALLLERVQQDIEKGYALRTELRNENEKDFSALLADMPKGSEKDAASVQRLAEDTQLMNDATVSVGDKLQAARRQIPVVKARTEIWLWEQLRPADARALVARLKGKQNNDVSGDGDAEEQAVKGEEAQDGEGQ